MIYHHNYQDYYCQKRKGKHCVWAVLNNVDGKAKQCHCYGRHYRVFKILKTELPYDSVIPLLDIHSKEIKSKSQRYISTLMFIASLFTVAKVQKNLCPLTNEQIKKMQQVSEKLQGSRPEIQNCAVQYNKPLTICSYLNLNLNKINF